MLPSSMRLLRLLLLVRDSRRNRRRHDRKAAASRPRIEVLEGRALPSTVSWINPGGGDWDTAANWLDDTTGTNHVPGPADDAVIDTAGITVTHAAFNSDSVNSVTSAATLAVSNGTLSIATDSDVDSLNLSGGTLTGAGNLTIDNGFSWTGGSMSGTGHTVLNGTATVGGGVFGPVLDTRTLDNAGAATVPDGMVLRFANNALWDNEAGATLTLQGSAALGNFFGQSGRLGNAGQLVTTGSGSSTATVNIPVDNPGTVDVQTGSLSLASLTNEGEFDLAAGAAASLSGGSSSGAMNVAAGGTLNVTGAFTQQSGGAVTLAAGGTLNVGAGFSSGTYTMQDGTAVSGRGDVVLGGVFGGSALNVTGGASVDNLVVGSGTVSVAAGDSLTVLNLTLSGGTVTIAAGGSLDARTLTQTGGTLTGAGTATVDHTLTWTGGTMSGTGQTVLNGNATVGQGPFGPTLDTRTLDNAGSATVPDGKTLLFANNALWNNEAGATLTLDGSAALGNFFGQAGRLSNAGLVARSGTGDSTSTVNFPLDNTGTVRVRTGTLSLASLTNEGAFDLAAGAAANLSGGNSSGTMQAGAGSTLNVTGAFTQQSGGAVTLAAGGTLNVGAGFSSGTYTMQDGTAVSGPGNVVLGGVFGGSSLNVAGGASIDNLDLTSGTVSVAAAASLEVRNLMFSGGTLTGPGTVTIDHALTWTGGTMSGPGSTALNGTATLSGGPVVGREVDNGGAATVADGANPGFANNALWNNEPGATLTLEGSAALGSFFNNSGRLSNAGLVARSGTGNSTSTVSIPLDNTGTVRVRTGTLSLASLTNEGDFDLAAGTTASLSGGSSSGTIQVGAGSTLNVTGAFTQQSGGAVTLAAGGTLNVGAGFSNGTYTMQDGTAVTGRGDVVLGGVFGGSSLNVAGGASVDNLVVGSGTVSVTAVGSLAVQNMTLSGGTVTIAAGGVLDAQTLNQTGGTLTGAGTAIIDGTLTWTGGTMSGIGHTVVNGNATVGQGPFGPTLDTRTLDNAGDATVPDGKVLLFANNALWNNEAGATLTLQGSAALGNFFGQSGQLSNAGQLFTTGNGQAAINFAVTNSGTVDLQGVLSVGGNYTQTGDGTLNIHLGGTAVGSQYDQLQVHGVAALDGTLNVTLVNGFTPANGDSFRILTFNSRSGDFAAMNLPDPGNGLVLNPVYDATGLTLLTEPAGP